LTAWAQQAAMPLVDYVSSKSPDEGEPSCVPTRPIRNRLYRGPEVAIELHRAEQQKEATQSGLASWISDNGARLTDSGGATLHCKIEDRKTPGRQYHFVAWHALDNPGILCAKLGSDASFQCTAILTTPVARDQLFDSAKESHGSHSALVEPD